MDTPAQAPDPAPDRDIFEAVFEFGPDGLLLIDREGRIAHANPRAGAMLGVDRDSLIGRSIEEFVPAKRAPHHRALVKSYFMAARTRPMGSGLDLFARRADGSEFPVDIALATAEVQGETFAIAALRDMSEERRVHDELAHAQRLDLVGKLTGGIAHSFNNILSILLANLQLLQKQCADPDMLVGIEGSLRAVRRGSEVAGRLLTFTGPHSQDIAELRLGPVLHDLELLMRSTLPANVRLSIRYHDDDVAVRCDPWQLQSVLLSLLLNARDALDAEHGGSIEVAAKVEPIAADTSADTPAHALPPGAYVALSVTDNGTGMDADTLSRAFDPYFTTKLGGLGTGLGLPMAQRFAETAQGDLRLESTPGAGTTVRLRLPLTTLPDDDALAREGQPAPLRILVVDDDPDVLTALKRLLVSDGHEVVPVASREDAIAACRAGPAFDVALCDIALYGKEDGIPLARTLKDMDKGLSIALMTGHADLTSRPDKPLPGPVLVKPFNQEQLDRFLLQSRRPPEGKA